MAYIDDPVTQRANLDYIKVAMRRPLLERADEFALAQRWRNEKDAKALHALINSYARLVISVAARFRNYGLPTGDLIQEGNVGLMQAAARFEPERAVRFSTYATWWIRSAMQDYVLRNWSIVRTGTTAAQKSLFFNLRRLRGKIENDGESLTDENRRWIADQLKVGLSDVTEMEIRFAGADQSLNAPLRETGDGRIAGLRARHRAQPGRRGDRPARRRDPFALAGRGDQRPDAPRTADHPPAPAGG